MNAPSPVGSPRQSFDAIPENFPCDAGGLAEKLSISQVKVINTYTRNLHKEDMKEKQNSSIKEYAGKGSLHGSKIGGVAGGVAGGVVGGVAGGVAGGVVGGVGFGLAGWTFGAGVGSVSGASVGGSVGAAAGLTRSCSKGFMRQSGLSLNSYSLAIINKFEKENKGATVADLASFLLKNCGINLGQ